jgi:dihydroorotate dehydrogenase (NAD+) catalytic subunit
MTNSVATRVTTDSGAVAFEGGHRGICGTAIRVASIAQVRMFAELCGYRRERVELIGCGGAATAEDVENYLAGGAVAVHIATAAMVNPQVGLEIKRNRRSAASTAV